MTQNGKIVPMEQFDDEATFTTTEVADYFGKSPQTIRNWSNDVNEFMSIHAGENSGRNRTYTITDIRVLQYVHEERTRDEPMENIIISLHGMRKDGRLEGLPILNPEEIKNRLAISEDTAQRLTISMLRTELETKTIELAHLQDVQVENARLEVRVEEKDKRIEQLMAELEESKATLQEKIDELNEKILAVTREVGEAYYKGRFDQATGSDSNNPNS